MNAHAASHINSPRQLLPTHELPVAPLIARPEPCVYCRTFHHDYQIRHQNGTRLPVDALDTLSSTNIRIAAQAYFDAARAASLRALESSQLDPQATENERQRAWKDQGNAQLLNKLADTMDYLKERHQRLEKQEKQNVRLRVQYSEIKQLLAEQEQGKTVLASENTALKQCVKDLREEKHRIVDKAKKKYWELRSELNTNAIDTAELEAMCATYGVVAVLGTTIIPEVVRRHSA